MSDENNKKVLDDMLNTIKDILDPKRAEQKALNDLQSQLEDIIAKQTVPLEDYQAEETIENPIMLLLCEDDYLKTTGDLKSESLDFIPNPPEEYPCLAVFHFESYDGIQGVTATYIYKDHAAALMNVGKGN